MEKVSSAVRLYGTLLLLAIASAWLTAVSQAQSFRGAIIGTIIDQTGAPIAGADVTVKNVGTDLSRTVKTDDAGNFSLPELPLGSYQVIAAKPGFTSVTQTGVPVDVAADRRVDFTLQTGTVKATVEVSAAVPLVDTTQDSLGATLQSRTIAALPVNGRDFTKMLYLTPGVSGSPDQESDSPGSYGTLTANGARGRLNNFIIRRDGHHRWV